MKKNNWWGDAKKVAHPYWSVKQFGFKWDKKFENKSKTYVIRTKKSRKPITVQVDVKTKYFYITVDGYTAKKYIEKDFKFKLNKNFIETYLKDILHFSFLRGEVKPVKKWKGKK